MGIINRLINRLQKWINNDNTKTLNDVSVKPELDARYHFQDLDLGLLQEHCHYNKGQTRSVVIGDSKADFTWHKEGLAIHNIEKIT